MSGTTYTGNVTVDGPTTVEGSNTYDGAVTIENGGTLTFEGDDQDTANGPLNVLPGGTLVADAGASFLDAGGITNAGLIDLSGDPNGVFTDRGGFVNDANGTVLLGGTMELDDPLTNNGTLIGAGGVITGGSDVVNNGTIQSGPSLTIDTAITGTGTIDVGTGSDTLTLNGSVASGQTVDFTGAGGTIALGNGQSFNGTINGFADSNSLDFTNVPVSEFDGYGYDFGSGQLNVSERNGTTIYLNVPGVSDSEFNNLTISSDANGDLVIEAPCFCPGTRITTDRGDVVVEDLAAGDLVRTADSELRPVQWIGRRRASNATVVHFRPGSLPVGPDRDLFVSDDHAMFVGGVLVPAGLLVNGTSITAEQRETVTFFHVELDQHAILLAEGAPAESYLDTGNRRQFSNCPLGYDAAVPGQEPCAELVLAGTQLEEIRTGLPALVPAD